MTREDIAAHLKRVDGALAKAEACIISQDLRIADLETLLARNLVFDADSAEEALEALGGWDRMTRLVDAARATRSAEGVQA